MPAALESNGGKIAAPAHACHALFFLSFFLSLLLREERVCARASLKTILIPSTKQFMVAVLLLAATHHIIIRRRRRDDYHSSTRWMHGTINHHAAACCLLEVVRLFPSSY